jgi:hypothetical protein
MLSRLQLFAPSQLCKEDMEELFVFSKTFNSLRQLLTTPPPPLTILFWIFQHDRNEKEMGSAGVALQWKASSAMEGQSEPNSHQNIIHWKADLTQFLHG